jgi:hypothetical protein
MKKVYVFFVFLFTLFIFGVKVKVDAVPLPTTSGDLSIEVDEKLPTSFLVNTEAPNFQDYFIVKLGNAIQQTDVDLFLDGFDIGVIGDYLISGSIKIGTDTVGIELPVKVIESDTEGPVITIKKPLHIEDEFGRTPWDSQETMVSLMDRFFIWDAVEGYIAPTESMFEGIEEVRLNQYGEEFPIDIFVEDSKGNQSFLPTIRLFIVNTIGNVLIEVNEDLPLEVVVNTQEPDFTKYFKVTDNMKQVEITNDYILKRNFDVTQVGIYDVSIRYQREYVFDRNRDIKQTTLQFKVIEADVSAPEIITYRIVDELIDGKLHWSYQNMDDEAGRNLADDSLEVFMQRFRVKDNVDGTIPITYIDEDGNIKADRSFFKGIENVRLDQKDAEYVITFEVTDRAGNTATQVITLVVVDDKAPIYLDFKNKYYRINHKVDLVEMLNTIGLIDNYDKSDSVLKIVINYKDLFEQVQMSYHDLEKYKDRFTPEELEEAAKAYNYQLKNGTHKVRVIAFRSNNEKDVLVDKEIEIVIENNKIKNMFTLHEQLNLETNNGLVMYYLTNFEDAKNGEFAIMLDAKDSSGNIAPTRTLRVVIENGPTLGTILLVINAGAIVIFAAAVGIYFLVKSKRVKKEEVEK